VDGVYFIKHVFPFPVFDEYAVSRFKKQQHTLTITLPIVPPARIASIQQNQPMAAHLSSDSSVLSTTPPVVVTDPLLAKASVTSADISTDSTLSDGSTPPSDSAASDGSTPPSDSAASDGSTPPSDSTTSDGSTPPIATPMAAHLSSDSSVLSTTPPVVVTEPLLAKASVTSVEHKADILIVPVAPVAESSKVKAVKSSVAKSIRAKAAYRLSFDGFNKCMESFKRIKWNVDVHRKDSPGAGKGIFCLRPIKKSNCVALYPGHLVDDKGAVVVTCPSTRSLFKRLPIVQRPFSRGHGVNVNSVACPHVLIVDGQFECAA
jgi:hypothetical protein